MKILLGLSAAVLLAASPTTVGAWFYGTGYTAAATTTPIDRTAITDHTWAIARSLAIGRQVSIAIATFIE